MARLFDNRWDGMHGIGRFSSELKRRLPEFSDVTLGGKPFSALDPWHLESYLRKVNPEFYLSPGYNAPLGRPCAFAFTVHDLNHIRVKSNSTALKRAYYRYVIRPAIFRACVVFTVSEFSKREILDWCGVSDDKVVVVRQGVASEFVSEGDRYGAERPYFLYVGSDRAHKNLRKMLRAFADSGLAGDVEFIITGTVGKELREALGRWRISGSVRILDGVADRELACLYRGAIAVVFVSLYEGFGLPIVEAMSCGSPVITSDVAAMPEIANGAAILVDPGDTEAITVAMLRLVADDALREELKARGRKCALEYDWRSAAERVREELKRRI